MSLDTSGGHPDMDYKEHMRTYDGFLAGSKILIVATIIILVGMAIFLL